LSQDEQDTNTPPADNHTPAGNDQPPQPPQPPESTPEPGANGNQDNSNAGDFQGQVGSVGIGPGTQIT